MPDARAICHASDLEALMQRLQGDDIWQHRDEVGRRWCRFVLDGSGDTPTSGWAVHSPAGTVVAPYSSPTTRVEILVRGSYEINGRESGSGTVTIIPANRVHGPVTYGTEGGVTLEMLSDPAIEEQPVVVSSVDTAAHTPQS